MHSALFFCSRARNVRVKSALNREVPLMAIQIYCINKLPNGKVCKTSNSLEAEECSYCGTVFNRKNRKFRVCVSVKGKRQNRIVDNLTIARETEATLKSDLLREEFDITLHKVKKTVTLSDVWNKYLPWAKEHKKSWQDDELYYNKHISPRFGDKPLENISPLDIEKMKTEMKKSLNRNGKPYAPATIKHQIVIIRRLYNLAEKWGLYSGMNPVSKVQMPKLNNEKTEYLTDDEFKKLLNVIETWPHKHTAALVKFALFTGLRRGEVFKLKWDDLDFRHSLITLKDPKGNVTKSIPLSNEALAIVNDLEVKSEYVFPNVDGDMRAKSSIRDCWIAMKKKADIPADFRWHGLRHNYASWLVSNGVDLAVVKELMTHKHIATTQRYAHLMPGALKDAAAKGGKLFSSVGKTRKVAQINKK